MQLQTIAIVLIMFTLKTCRAQIDNQTVMSVTALSGDTARLPCHVAPEVYRNNITVLTWYNDKSTKAIYSRDHRGEAPTPATSRSDHRFEFWQAPPPPPPLGATASTAFLLIKPVLAEDAGLYRCHVDFDSSRSHDTYVRLNIIENPSYMILLNGNGTKLTGDTAGPYREGDDALLICVVFGGDPLPNVTWWHDTELVDDTWSQFSLRRVRNELVLGKLKRQHYGQQYTCQAANNHISAPITTTVTIDMYLKPTHVILYASQEPVRAGPFELQCRILGARPTPTFIWMMGHKQLDLEQYVAEDSSGRGDLSTVTISTTPHDNGLNVTCCTERRSRKLALMCSAPHTLNIYYSPVVQLTLDNEVVNETAVLLGSTLTLACNITANPWIFNFIWFFNDEVIKSSDVSGGSEESIDGDSPCPTLTLENVTAAAGGVYRCSATNNEGIGHSQQLTLDIQYSPRCKNSGFTEYGVGSSDAVNMTCDVSGNPAPDTYRWIYVNGTLNTTEPGKVADCAPLDTTVDNTMEYRISDKFGYGTVLCWGQNDVSNVSSSDHEDACYFTITDLSVPHQPTGCVVVRQPRQDGDGISVTCEKGHDGGLQQKFTLTLLSGSGEELLSVSALEPQLTTHEPPDPDYSILIVAHNDKGTTEPITLTRADVTQLIEYEGARGVVADVGTLLLSLGGGVGVVVLVACALVMGARELRSDTGSESVPKARSLRRRTSTTCPYTTDESNCDTCQDSEGGSESSFHRTESFHRAVSGKQEPRDRGAQRGGSFRAPRCITNGSPLLKHTNSCRLHSLQNICTTLNRRREGEALCDHLLLHLPVDLPNYSIPKTPIPFYTMPRNSHLRVKPQDTDHTQNLNSLPLPPPPEEFQTFRSATDILNKESPVSKPSASNNYMNVPRKADNAYNNVIISPMNTVGLPSSTTAAVGTLYTYPEDKPHSVVRNEFEVYP